MGETHGPTKLTRINAYPYTPIISEVSHILWAGQSLGEDPVTDTATPPHPSSSFSSERRPQEGPAGRAQSFLPLTSRVNAR